MKQTSPFIKLVVGILRGINKEAKKNVKLYWFDSLYNPCKPHEATKLLFALPETDRDGSETITWIKFDNSMELYLQYDALTHISLDYANPNFSIQDISSKLEEIFKTRKSEIMKGRKKWGNTPY
jgi:hypothetical protein